MKKQHSDILLNDIITNNKITMFFQPIVSAKSKTIVGVEALCRAYDTESTLITPNILFDWANKNKRTQELDFKCRHKAIDAFSKCDNEGLILFINIEASVISIDCVYDELLNLIHDYQLKPENIVIEINEKHIKNLDSLIDFIDFAREKGFLIALDDVGAGHSNLNRITIAKPDIVKIDKWIINGIHNDYYKQETLRALVNMSMKIGAITVAEGIEEYDEAITCLRLGVNLLQGYYFARPHPIEELNRGRFYNLLQLIAKGHKANVIEQFKKERQAEAVFKHIIIGITDELKGNSAHEQAMHSCINAFSNIECLYVLDKSGIQITRTIMQSKDFTFTQKSLFNPATKGTDHSMKEYYYMVIDMDTEVYATDWYISNASGNLCKTISTRFCDEDNSFYVLCMDIQKDI